MTTKHTLCIAMLLLSLASRCAMALEIDRALPPLQIDGGEITLSSDRGNGSNSKNEKPHYHDWPSSALVGEVTLLQILSASRQSSTINQAFMDKFEAQFGASRAVASTTIVTSNNIPSLFSGFVKSELKRNKQRHPQAVIINDKQGLSRQRWQLPDTLAISVLLDKNGVVRKYHEGQLSSSESDAWIIFMHQLLAENN